MKKALRYLFVCTGNICRSPMAEVLARDLLEGAGVSAEVSSAGTLGIVGHPADQRAQEVLAEWGHDLSSHRSQGVTVDSLREADAIVVMSPEHELDLLSMDPEAGDKIDRLWEYCDPPGRLTSIIDPVGCDRDVFREARDDLLECLRTWMAQRHAPR